MSHPPQQHPTELLPWLANGSLQGEERKAVESHVAGCAECQAELKLLQRLRQTIRSQPLPEAGDLGLQRLLREARRQSVSRPRWLLPAALAASLVIAVQAVMLLQSGPQEPVYAPLSGPAAGEGQLQVEFMPDAREADLRELLRESGVRIVDGPSAAGLYRLAVNPGQDPRLVAQKLRASKALIRHIALER